MTTRTYISNFATIFKDSELNTGINPIGELFYGGVLSRMLLYFDTSKVKSLVERGDIQDMSKLKHTLHITNAGSLDFSDLHAKRTSDISGRDYIRTSSFELIFFKIPQDWDGGKGFDHTLDFFNTGYYKKDCTENVSYDKTSPVSIEGVNWYNAKSGVEWDTYGVYTTEELSLDYDKFRSDAHDSEYIFATQRFDIGNEDINIDITELFNKFLLGEECNYGIGIAFAPRFELREEDCEKYVGFLTHKTDSFFEPYVETVYDDHISDDRGNFILGKDNKLYLYCTIGGMLQNLDELPTCSVDGKEYDVKQFGRGVYYIDIKMSRKDHPQDTMYYDVWSNIKYNGEELPDVELDFVTRNGGAYFNVADGMHRTQYFIPTIYGIDDYEKIRIGDVRKISFHNKLNYERNKDAVIDNIEWRLYILDGAREVTVFDYQKANKTFNENYDIIDTESLLPSRYHIDVRYTYNLEQIVHHDIISFDIVNEIGNQYN